MYSTDGLCPPFASANSNIFASTFGIKFNQGPETFIRPFSPFEYASCYRHDGDLTYTMSHASNFFLLDCDVIIGAVDIVEASS